MANERLKGPLDGAKNTNLNLVGDPQVNDLKNVEAVMNEPMEGQGAASAGEAATPLPPPVPSAVSGNEPACSLDDIYGAWLDNLSTEQRVKLFGTG
jgi:hypothetical protein